jgi:Flp pilus assembly protein TadD
MAALYGEAGALYQAGRLDEAVAAFHRIVAMDPSHSDSWHVLGVIALQQRQHQQAAHYLTRAVRLRPSAADAHWNLGIARLESGKAEHAIASFRKALHLQPNNAALHAKFGGVLIGLDRLEEALRSHQRALRLDSANAELHFNVAAVLKRLGHTDQALAEFSEVVRLAPDHPEAHYCHGIMLLLAGRFEEGWPEFEWRWRTHLYRSRGYAQPQWRGEPRRGQPLLVFAEQGFGDTIQFCRYIPRLAEDGPVILQLPTQLIRLLSHLPAVRVFAHAEEPSGFDLYCPMLSLPSVCRTTLGTIPADVPYLQAEPRSVEAWRQRLAGDPGLLVGVAWGGNEIYVNESQRSIKACEFIPLTTVPGVALVSLQKGTAADQTGAFPPGTLRDWTNDLSDFTDTAALIAALDLVISVDTSVVHLAGALGKPVWLLNRFDPDWRWLLGRDDSPWYPTLRQFRQSRPGDWSHVLHRVRIALSSLAQQTPARP